MKTLLLFTSLLIFSLAFAQGKEATKCHLSLVYFGDIGKDRTFYLRKGKSKQFVKLAGRPSSVAKPVTYQGDTSLSIYRKDDSKNLGYKQVGICKLPKSMERGIIVSAFDKKSRRFTFTLVDSSIKKLPFGARLLINNTEVKLRGKYQSLPNQPKKLKMTFKLNLGDQKLIKPLDPEAKALTPHGVLIELFDQKTAKWNTFFTSRWFHSPEERMLLIASHNLGAYRIHTITDGTLRPANSKPYLAYQEEDKAKLARTKKRQSREDKYMKRIRSREDKEAKKRSKLLSDPYFKNQEQIKF